MKIQLRPGFLIIYFIVLFLTPVNILGQLTIDIDAPSLANRSIELGYFYGSKTFLGDTIRINSNGTGKYIGDYREGIYFLIMPDSSFHEFMVTNGNNYLITISRIDIKYRVGLKGNQVSEGFDAYNREFSVILKSIDSLKLGLQQTTDQFLRTKLNEELNDESGKLEILKSQYILEYRGSFLEKYLLALSPVDVNKINQSKGDSNQLISRLKLYQQHYLDNIDFNDERLIYTPILYEKVNTYLDKIVQQAPLALTMAIDTMFTAIRNNEVRQFILEELIKKYRLSIKRPLNEYVYAHLIEHYILTGHAPWMSSEQIHQFNTELGLIKPTLLLQSAPEINLPGADKLFYSLNALKSGYTILIFWDLNCPICKKVIQDLKTTVLKYNYLNISVYTIYTGTDFDFWRNFVQAKVPGTWINTHEVENNKVIRMYNISLTPMIILLNSDKKIIDKSLTVKELDSFFLKIALH